MAKGSAGRENGRGAAELLVMAFKPLILSVISTEAIENHQFEDAFQDGCVAFMEGLDRFDTEHGGTFNAFIQVHLRQYFRKWISGRFTHSVEAERRLDEKIPGMGGQTLGESLGDETAATERHYIEKTEEQANSKGLAEGLSRLTDGQREVIREHYGQCLSLREIARQQGKSHQSVSETHGRALRNLRKFFEE